MKSDQKDCIRNQLQERFNKMILSFVDLLMKAKQKGYTYATLITDYRLDNSEGEPYLIYIPQLLAKIENKKEPFVVLRDEQRYYFYDKHAAGIMVEKPRDYIIMFYTKEEKGNYSIKNIKNIFDRWEYIASEMDNELKK